MTAARGQARVALDAALAAAEDDCFVWPHAVGTSGYGQIQWSGKKVNVHRLVCEIAHGLPPFAGAQAAHSCHVRRCCNPHHLRWATAAENASDRDEAGSTARGETNGRSKLTAGQVADIKRRLATGAMPAELAVSLGVSRQSVDKIKRGVNWRSVEVLA